jgi:hypothetical protein
MKFENESMKYSFLAYLSLSLIGCGGVVSTNANEQDAGNQDASADAKNPLDGQVSPDGAILSGCPVSMPANGDVCINTGLQCEYGTDPRIACNALATCVSAKWNVTPGGDCSALNDGGTNGCPATQKDVPLGQACSPLGLVCAYGQDLCGCSRVNHQADLWICDTPDPACPYPRPKVGTPCSQEGQSCDYGSCTAIGGARLGCLKGTWQQANVMCPP